MLFKCGTGKKAVGNKKDAQLAKIKRLREWHQYFAWLPVKVDDEEGICALLQVVERRFPKADSTYFNTAAYGYDIVCGSPEYRLLTKQESK